jgi:D-proline reductase (dithiol) PrdB
MRNRIPLQHDMGDFNEFSLPVRLFLKAYPWRRIEPVPWAPLQKALSECRVGLVTSAGFVLPGQPPFDPEVKGGDFSHREIPDAISLTLLEESHRSESFDHSGLQRDPNLAFPFDRLHELVAEKVIGSANRRHFSFMGSLTAPGRFQKTSAPEMAAAFLEDQVDLALLVPV